MVRRDKSDRCDQRGATRVLTLQEALAEINYQGSGPEKNAELYWRGNCPRIRLWSTWCAPSRCAQKRSQSPKAPASGKLLLRHLEDDLKDLVRDPERLTVALEDPDGLTQGCAGPQRRVKLPRPKDKRRQMAL
jgi:hypothetical protein